jgi:hypothetical protein
LKAVQMLSRGLLATAMLGCVAAVGPASLVSPLRATALNAQEAPATMRRLTEAQYRNSIADIFGADIKIVGRFEPDLRVDGLLAVGTSAVSMTPGGLEQYEEIARGIAAQVTDEGLRDKLIGCAPGPADPAGVRCAENFLKRVGLHLYRRPLPVDELRRLVALTNSASRQLGGFHAGLAAALASMLTIPQFLFRIDAPGRGGEVDSYSKASHLSFLLWNTSPDQALLAAAADGTLDTAGGLAKEVDRLMASPRFVAGVTAFFTDFLQLDAMETLSKDSVIYPAFTSTVAAAAREQTLRTITDLLITHKGDYRDLFTTRRFAMNRVLGPLYDIPITRNDWYMHEFPEGDPRVGLLTQVSLLALHSHPGRTSPTLRGKALREELLCQKIPSPPANVNFAVVQDVNNPTLKTTRARLQAHEDDEECASCHRLTDPIGLGLEQFDGAGLFRTMEHDQRIDVTGVFDKQPFDGAAALGKLFHDSSDVSDCLVMSAWKYANGRQASLSDEAQIVKLTEQLASTGYRFTTLFRAIALDPGFYRIAPISVPALKNSSRAKTGHGGTAK